MRNLRSLLAAALSVQVLEFNSQWLFSGKYLENKPNRVSQKKRRLNRRRKGK